MYSIQGSNPVLSSLRSTEKPGKEKLGNETISAPPPTFSFAAVGTVLTGDWSSCYHRFQPMGPGAGWKPSKEKPSKSRALLV